MISASLSVKINSARPSLSISQTSKGVGVTGEGNGLTTKSKVKPRLTKQVRSLSPLVVSALRNIVCGLAVLRYGLVRASRGSPVSA